MNHTRPPQASEAQWHKKEQAVTDSQGFPLDLPQSATRPQRQQPHPDSIPQIIWSGSSASGIAYFNCRWYDFTGLSEAQSLGFSFLAVIHPEDRDRWRACFQQPATVEEIEFRLLGRDDIYKWFVAHIQVNHGPESLLTGTCTNIDKFKKTETALEKQQQLLQALWTKASEGIVLCDSEGAIIAINPAAKQLHGIPANEPAPQEANFFEQNKPGIDSGQTTLQSLEYSYYEADGKTPIKRDESPLLRALNGEVVSEVEMRVVSADGSRRSLLATGTAIVNNRGDKLGALVTLRDITAQKQKEELWLQTQERYQLIAENSSELICRLRAGIYLYVSPAALRLLGYAPTELIGRDALELIHPEQRTEIQKIYQSIFSERASTTLTNRLRRKDGNYIWVETTLLPRFKAAGFGGEEIISITREITVRKQLEAEIGNLYREIDRLTRKHSIHLQAANQLKDELLGRELAVRANLIATQEHYRTEQQRMIGAMHLLIEASSLFASSLDSETVLVSLAQLIVPYLGDWCVINAVDAYQTCRCVAVAHKDPAKENLIWQLQQRYPVEADGSYSYLKPLNSGGINKSDEIYVEFGISDQQLQTLAVDAEHFALLKKLNFRSYICLPLRLGQQSFGSILFVLSDKNRRYSPADLTLAEDLGHRTASALEKVQLYREAQQTSKNLSQVILVLDQQQQQLRTLQRLTNLLNQSLTDLPGLLQVMVDAVCESVPGAMFCLIVLHNPATNRLELVATAGTGTEHLPLRMPLYTEDGLLSTVFSTGASSLLRHSEPGDDGEGVELPAAVYGVPIESAQAGRLGVLATGNWNDPQAFDYEMWQQLLVAVGEQAAIAINNARLIHILEEREELVAEQNHILASQNKELAHQREHIQLQNLQLLQAARLKTQFLATMSHELRTPLNAIIGFAQLLLRNRSYELPAPQQDMAQRILNNGKSLLMLINDILDLSKIEAGIRDVKPETFEITHLINATVQQFKPQAEEKNLTLAFRSENLQNHWVFLDKSCLRQVLINLVSNAIKFTDAGSVEVEVSDLEPNRVEILVKDTGIGISETELKHIFEAFRQVDQTLTRRFPGTGLGLAITDSLVQLMRGTISLESTLGKGSLFKIILPRHS
ncbi:PAS domain S-box protein [Ancylothrix sp. C2]|uniref:PAS domain S-box protein n=1 Tax=Ancylothrix sp. D3o TaxID=2953691 RepID=UPI0021BA4BF0|nr:PAS domain S-box protein [Ancylothrix sp. D3o]MCT7951339.1 PAS domain S-box protein [Ancylothrix sp. D3o]